MLRLGIVQKYHHGGGSRTKDYAKPFTEPQNDGGLAGRVQEASDGGYSMMSPEETVETIIKEFFRRIEGSRWGTLGQIQRRLNLNKNFFNGWRNAPGRPRLLPLLGALECLGLRPSEFFATALKADAPCGPEVGKLAAQLIDTATSSPELEHALELLQAAVTPGDGQVEGLQLRFSQRWALRGEVVGERGKVWLEELDELRYTAAPAVIASIDEHLEEIDPDEIPFSLGVLGSAQRMNFDYTRAEGHIKQGLKFADEVLDHLTAGGLHQRLSMVWSDCGDYAGAYSQNCFAIARHQECENSVGVARTMVDRGIIQGHRGCYQWSTSAFHKALERLPESETKNRATALHGLAHNSIAQGDRSVAIRFALKAERIPVDPLNSAKLTWSAGAILATAGQYLDAFPRLRKARQTLEALAPVDAALVTIDICEVFLLSGQPAEAYKEAKKMLAFLEPLRARTVLAEGAAYELAAIGVRGKGLTFAALATARTRINAKPANRL